MKIIAFTDQHENAQMMQHIKKAIASAHADVAVCLGDYTIFGRSTKKILEELNALSIPVVFIHGNHDDEDETRALLPKLKNLHFVHKDIKDIMGFRFMGYGGNGFQDREPELEHFEQTHAKEFNEKTIFLCHAPPQGTALDETEPGWHVGSQSLRELIKRHRPMLVLTGHIHECFHAHDTLAGTTLINPGPDGEIIDLEE